MGIFCQPFIPNFGEAKAAFHHTKDVFDFGAHFRFITIPAAIHITERDIAAAFLVGEIFGPRSMLGNNASFSE